MSEEKTVEFIFDKMEPYFDAASKVIEQYGGDVAELGLNVLRIEALSELIVPIIFLITIIALSKYIKKIHIWGFTHPDNDVIPVLVLPVLLDVAIFFVVLSVLNLWAWIGIFYPELYAVHKFLLN